MLVSRDAILALHGIRLAREDSATVPILCYGSLMTAAKSDKRTVTLDRGWVITLKDLGVQPENVVRRARLPLDLLKQDQVRVTSSEYFALWEAMEAETGDPTLPIRLCTVMSSEAFNPPIFAALCSPDLSTAARRLAAYKKLIGPMTLHIEDTEDGLSIEKRWDDPTVVLPPGLGATELVFLVQIARIGTREPIRPTRVESRYAMDPIEAYAEFFGTRPVLSERHCVTFSAADARRPFLTASESLWNNFETELQRRISKLEAAAPLHQRVHSILLETLPSGEPSIDAAARRLGVSARTLQRTLKEEGTSYKEVVRVTREKLARHYVTKTTLSYGEIAFLIGFDEPSSFFRAFREWTGQTPETLRMGA